MNVVFNKNHYELSELNVFDVFQSSVDITFFDTQIVPSLDSESLLRFSLSPFHRI